MLTPCSFKGNAGATLYKGFREEIYMQSKSKDCVFIGIGGYT